jgi:hypothetical protein
MSDLDEQVEQERKVLEQAPKQAVSNFQPQSLGQQGRCGWCGRWSQDLVQVEPGRYKGVECCGGRHL